MLVSACWVEALFAIVADLHNLGLDCLFTFVAHDVVSVRRTWPIMEVWVITTVAEWILACRAPDIFDGIQVDIALATFCSGRIVRRTPR